MTPEARTRTYDEAARAIDVMHDRAIRAAREARDAIEEVVGRAFDEALKPFGEQAPSEVCPQAVTAYDDGMERAKRVYRVLVDAADEAARAARAEISGMPGLTPMGHGDVVSSGAVSTSGDQLQAIIAALDAHDAEWAHRHVSKRPNVPEALRRAIDAARSDNRNEEP